MAWMPGTTVSYTQPVQPTVEQIIVERAVEYGVDPNIALSVAWAESQFKNVPNYKYDGEDGHYTAYGIFQITSSTYRHFCGESQERMDIEKNIECAMIIMSQDGGLNHWSESFEGWKDLPRKNI